MDVIPVVDEGLGNSAYLVDLGDGGALVVDPERDPRPYFGELDRRGLVPRFVVETHLHADFVSGGRELIRAGAQLLAQAGSELAFDHRPLRDGDELDLGGLTLEVVATPGHTPEHLAYLLRDADRPVALFSGGTLMAGGVARPDLLSADQTEPLARAAYRSIHQRLLTLPDNLAVYPTHGGGSFCSVAGAGQRTTTIGRERASNPLFVDSQDEDTFVARLLGGLGTYPAYFLELRDVNRSGPAVHGRSAPALPQLDLETFDAVVADGAEVVDVRQIGPFAAGHIPGSLSNPWRGQFATWLGWLVGRTRPVVFITDDTVARHDLVWAALTVGFERLVGELAGGVEAWQDAGRTLATTPLVNAAGAEGRQVLDIRQQTEFVSGHVPGALHVELGTLADRFGRKPVLLVGWLFAIPVPLLLIWAPSWGWVVFANVLLGVNQGLAWSITVIMKIDLVGPAKRGTAMGFNEAAGYGAVAVAAWAAGAIAETAGLRPGPFLLGLAFAALGIGLSSVLVRETAGHVAHEVAMHDGGPNGHDQDLTARQVFALGTWRDRSLSSASQAGLVNNLNEGMAWGLFPVLFALGELDLATVGLLVAIAPAVWGVGQLFIGALSDRVGRKWLIAGGQFTEAAGLLVIALGDGFAVWALGSAMFGAGTAMAYPTLIAAVGDVAHPAWRGAAVGVYRLWRDIGFAVGAVLAGTLADLYSLSTAIIAVAIITAASGLDVTLRMTETHPPQARAKTPEATTSQA